MVAIRSFFILSAAVGIASAGKCKPESLSSSVVSVPSSTVSASDTASSAASTTVTLIESSTTLADTTAEMSLTGSATETASTATSADATETSITESKPTTFLTSFTTSNAGTTTEAATTTTAAAGPVVTCPSDVQQCLGTIKIQCDVLLSGLNNPTGVADLNECTQQCNSDASCLAFTYSQNSRSCFKATRSSDYVVVDLGSWVSGIKGTCGESPEPSTTVFTSTAETTTTDAATTTTTAAPVNNCPSETGQCVNGALIQCDVVLGNLIFAGISTDITQCAQFCDPEDSCRGFSRRRDTGACALTFSDPDDVTQVDREGWDSGILNTCLIQAPSTCSSYTRRSHASRSTRHTRHGRDGALDPKGTRQLATQKSRLQRSLAMAGYNSRRLLEFHVPHTIVSAEKPAEVIYDPALRVDGVWSSGRVVVVSGGDEYGDSAMAVVALETSACDGV
ncbi:hypothetical protein FGADI_8121 [Fusarium gaditjirri]|uniref:Apple domain-containing protein n=1 Tax=Fusarium gaditjirri TaxID=282569 RepID=A0A8H4T3E3_9HYPO|nr:hypothetical protein FGADI_8121 [Fusarium gaditjirri]